MLPLTGENDGAVAGLSVSDEEFRAFVERHSPLNDTGIAVVPEDNTAMTNSYLMISPDGRFFWHVPDSHGRTLEYGDPILEAGFDKAFEQVRFAHTKFRDRGGAYDWLR